MTIDRDESWIWSINPNLSLLLIELVGDI